MILSAEVMFFGDSFNSIEQCTEYEERFFLAMSVSLLQNLLSSIKNKVYVKYIDFMCSLILIKVQFHNHE